MLLLLFGLIICLSCLSVATSELVDRLGATNFVVEVIVVVVVEAVDMAVGESVVIADVFKAASLAAAALNN